MDDRSLRLGPGKSAPRLINDLLDYDPTKLKNNGRNLLADDAPQFRGKGLLRKGFQDCRHVLMKKLDRTNAPISIDEQPDESTKYVIATYCSTCRCHIDITVNFENNNGRQIPCRLSDPKNPLHHLRLVESADGKEYEQRRGGYKKYDTFTEAHRFECSGATCPIVVDIKISPPRLGKKMLSLVLDPKKVYARGRKVIQEEPLRFNGFGPITPSQALTNLRTYLHDARDAKDPENLKKIAKRNKRLLLGFADECDSFFEYLDFKVVQEDGPDPAVDEPNYFWQLPVVTDINRNFIDDVLFELDVILNELSASDQRNQMKVTHAGVLALKDIDRSLGCFDYPKASRTVDLSKDEHPHYASLGAVDQFTDDLLSWAYDRQCECDPANKPYYLDCLADIAKGRQSSDLETKVVIATSAGQHGLKEIEDAYKFFALDSTTTEGDDHIIGVYTARIDSAPRQKDEARQCLRVIASARESEKIRAVANDQTMSLDEALEFLNVTEDTPSDSIQAAAVVLAFDADNSRVVGALRVIAARRDNDLVLLTTAAGIESGEGGQTLSIKDAFTRLQIKEQHVPDETVWTYYQSLAGEAPPGSKDSFDEALRVIALDRNSQFLLTKLNNPNADVQATRTTSDEPVGLENIGNTCYLNSLLQFYYTIKPLRDVVMDFDAYRMDPNDPDISNGKKRVGSRVVDKAEVVKAQKFVNELHGLYENLRTASTRSVKPTKQLAKSTFITKALEENFRVYRKQSISSPDGPPPMTSIFDRPVFGPEGPPQTQHRLPTPEEDIEMVDRPNDKGDNKSDSSEATLIEMEAESDQPPPYDESKGNQLFPKNAKTETVDSHNDLSDPFTDDAVMVNGDNLEPESNFPSPLEKPPPVPPRNKAGLSIQTTETKDFTESEEDGLWQFGTQQDVTEVMGNVINLLSCAIKPSGITEAGTQTDKVYDTFYGDSAVYTQKTRKLEKKVESWASLMVYPDDKHSRDIYEALDVNYDEQMVEIGNSQIPQWTSITKLPPILQIQIQRTAWNRGTGAGSKNSNPVVFPETIYLDRYMDSEDPDSPLMKRRRQAWKWKAALRKLEARQTALQVTEAEMSVPDALNETKKFINDLQEAEIEGLDISPELPDLLEARMEEVALELETISHQITTIKANLNEQFTNMRQYEYKLQTVFIHRGEAGGGHYWIYLYDFENDIWREYNDEYVTVVNDRKRIFEHQGGGTPYFLAYVRSADQKDLVNAVYRDVKEIDMTDVPNSWAEVMNRQLVEDEGIAMDQDSDNNGVRHIELSNPRPLLPKPAAGQNGWVGGSTDLDANGKPW